MKILVVADSHNSRPMLDTVPFLCREAGADRIFHLGDMISDAEELEASCGLRTARVPGNCDRFAFSYPGEVWETVGGKEYLLTHGHRYWVKQGLDDLARHAV